MRSKRFEICLNWERFILLNVSLYMCENERLALGWHGWNHMGGSCWWGQVSGPSRKWRKQLKYIDTSYGSFWVGRKHWLGNHRWIPVPVKSSFYRGSPLNFMFHFIWYVCCQHAQNILSHLIIMALTPKPSFKARCPFIINSITLSVSGKSHRRFKSQSFLVFSPVSLKPYCFCYTLGGAWPIRPWCSSASGI